MLEKPTNDCYENVRQQVASTLGQLCWCIGRKDWGGTKMYLRILSEQMPAGHRSEYAQKALYEEIRNCLDMMDPPVVLDVDNGRVEAPYVQGDGR